jgi:hypothetical protein
MDKELHTDKKDRFTRYYLSPEEVQHLALNGSGKISYWLYNLRQTSEKQAYLDFTAYSDAGRSIVQWFEDTMTTGGFPINFLPDV